jgi:hypothetical protein
VVRRPLKKCEWFEWEIIVREINDFSLKPGAAEKVARNFLKSGLDLIGK